MNTPEVLRHPLRDVSTQRSWIRKNLDATSQLPVGHPAMPNNPSWRLLLLPFGLLVILFIASPNFRWIGNTEAEIPYGGDFLQEWIGGTIVLSEKRERLYDSAYTAELQHDQTLTGLTWPADKYFPMVYPPHYYALVSPLAKLKYRWAFVVWSFLSAIAFSLSGWLLYRFYPPIQKHFAPLFMATCLFVPWIKCLSMGQKSAMLLLLFTGTFLLLRRGRNFWAGVLFGLVAIKPHLGIVIGLAMVFKLQWKFALGAGLSVLTLIGFSWMIEPTWWPNYLQVVSGMGNYVETGGYQLADSHSLWGGLQLTFAFLDTRIVKWLTIGLAIGLLSLVASGLRGKLATESESFTLQFAMLTFATVLLSPHFYSYDLTILILPMLLVVSRIGFRPQQVPEQWMLGLVFALFALAGLFPDIAATIRFQLSILVIGGLVYLLGSANPTTTSSDSGRTVRSSVS